MGYTSHTCTEDLKESQSFLWGVKYSPGRSSLFLSITNSQRAPLMKEQASGGKCTPVFYGQGELSWIHLVSGVGAHTCTLAYRAFLYSAEFILFCTREKLTRWSWTAAAAVSGVSLSDGDSAVFYYHREGAAEGSGRVLVCFGPGIFHVRSPGNPKEKKKTCPVPSSAPPPLCSTSLTGQSENETRTNTPLLAMKYVLATGEY